MLEPDGHDPRVPNTLGAFLSYVVEETLADLSGAVRDVQVPGWWDAVEWSPDGSKIAFVSDRENHSFVAVYDVRTRAVTYVAPSVDCDGAPTWSADSRRLAFLRRPGVPFGRQAQQGTGSIGNPPGPAARGGGNPGSCGFGGFGGGGGGQQQQERDSARVVRSPGFLEHTFAGGHRLQIMIADVTMSLDNVLAVAGAAHDHPWIMVFGLVLSIALMGVAATFIARILTKHRWVGYVGLVVVLYVALHMIWDGARSVIVRTDRMEEFNAAAPAFLDIGEEEAAKHQKGMRGAEESAAPAHGLPAEPPPVTVPPPPAPAPAD